MQKPRLQVCLNIFVSVLVILSGHGIGWGGSRLSIPMPDNADPMKFCSLPGGSSRIGYAGVIIESRLFESVFNVDGKVEQRILPLSDKVVEYLKNTHGKINIGEVYKKGSVLYYEMPRMAIYANEGSPLYLKDIEILIKKNLAGELVKSGKIKEGRLSEVVVFFAVEFLKEGDDFVVSHWQPEVLLQKSTESTYFQSKTTGNSSRG